MVLLRESERVLCMNEVFTHSLPIPEVISMTRKMTTKTLLWLSLGLGLSACVDMYETGYRYPRTRTYTQVETYHYVPPQPRYPAPQAPTTINSESNSSNYSIKNEYEINQNYYAAPPTDSSEQSSPDEYRRGGQYHGDAPDTPQQVYPGRMTPRFRGGDAGGSESPDVTRLGQQEFEKKMQQMRERRQEAAGGGMPHRPEAPFNAGPPGQGGMPAPVRQPGMGMQERPRHTAESRGPAAGNPQSAAPVAPGAGNATAPSQGPRHKAHQEDDSGGFQPNR